MIHFGIRAIHPDRAWDGTDYASKHNSMLIVMSCHKTYLYDRIYELEIHDPYWCMHLVAATLSNMLSLINSMVIVQCARTKWEAIDVLETNLQ